MVAALNGRVYEAQDYARLQRVRHEDGRTGIVVDTGDVALIVQPDGSYERENWHLDNVESTPLPKNGDDLQKRGYSVGELVRVRSNNGGHDYSATINGFTAHGCHVRQGQMFKQALVEAHRVMGISGEPPHPDRDTYRTGDVIVLKDTGRLAKVKRVMRQRNAVALEGFDAWHGFHFDDIRKPTPDELLPDPVDTGSWLFGYDLGAAHALAGDSPQVSGDDTDFKIGYQNGYDDAKRGQADVEGGLLESVPKTPLPAPDDITLAVPGVPVPKLHNHLVMTQQVQTLNQVWRFKAGSGDADAELASMLDDGWTVESETTQIVPGQEHTRVYRVVRLSRWGVAGET